MKGKRRLVVPALLVGILLVGAVGVGLAGGEEPKPRRQILFLDGRAWMGVQIGDVTTETARELKLPGEYGAVIEKVEDDSPAAKAGLQEKDVILVYAGERVRSARQLSRLVRETPPGRTVTLEVSRDGRTRSAEVTLEAGRARFTMPRIDVGRIEVPPIEIPEFSIGVFGRGPQLGISGDELTPQLAEYFGVKQGNGVLVREVLAGSAAAKAGVQAGDVIVGVDEQEVADVNDLRKALRRQREGKKVTLTIVRDRREQAVTVELDEPRRYGYRKIAGGVWVDPESCARYKAVSRKLDTQLGDMERRIRESLESIRAFMESKEFERKIRALGRKI